MKKDQIKIGPVQLLVIGFPPETKYEGRIIEELQRLDKIKTIRILDLLFVKKDEETSQLVALSIQGEELGAVVGAILGFEFDGEDKKERRKEIENGDGHAFGLTPEAIENIGKSLEPGMAAGVLLIEHVWAKKLKQAVRDIGGIPIAEGFLTQEVLSSVATEIEAIASAIDEMEEEELEQAKNGINEDEIELESGLRAYS